MVNNDVDFVKNKNYDDVFLRDLYSALSYFFIDVIKIKNVIDEKIVEVDIPVIPSFIGDENFIKDFFIKHDKICCGESVSTVLSRMPSGRIISSGSFVIDDSVISSNGVRTKREENVYNEFVEEKRLVYGRNTILGLNTSFNVDFRCNTVIERMKIFQAVVDNFHKERTFYFSSCGTHKIPSSVVITNQYRLEDKQQFKFSDYDGYLSLNVSFDLSTFYVVSDSLDKLTDQNRVFDPTLNISSDNK
jgi:hypothetical protein